MSSEVLLGYMQCVEELMLKVSTSIQLVVSVSEV